MIHVVIIIFIIIILTSYMYVHDIYYIVAFLSINIY